MYCLCVNVYCTTATRCQPNCSWQIYQNKFVVLLPSRISENRTTHSYSPHWCLRHWWRPAGNAVQSRVPLVWKRVQPRLGQLLSTARNGYAGPPGPWPPCGMEHRINSFGRKAQPKRTIIWELEYKLHSKPATEAFTSDTVSNSPATSPYFSSVIWDNAENLISQA
jgi:hypothetical protein